MRLGLGWSPPSAVAALGDAGTVELMTLGLVEEVGDLLYHDTPFHAVNARTLAVHLFHYYNRT